MENYYKNSLNAHKLFRVYETEILRVNQYLAAEIDFVKSNLAGTENILEIGAGYGRIIRELAPYCCSILGIDISEDNIELGKTYLRDYTNADMVVMDAHQLYFSKSFDVALCLQNGLSSMKADLQMIEKIISYVAVGGKAFFSSYSANFWDVRVQWFQEQAEKGLLEEIDMAQTKNGVIVCKDGFRATTYSPEKLREIGDKFVYPYEIKEVDSSSVFLIIHKI